MENDTLPASGATPIPGGIRGGAAPARASLPTGVAAEWRCDAGHWPAERSERCGEPDTDDNGQAVVCGARVRAVLSLESLDRLAAAAGPGAVVCGGCGEQLGGGDGGWWSVLTGLEVCPASDGGFHEPERPGGF